jgi:hypothetical protein
MRLAQDSLNPQQAKSYVAPVRITDVVKQRTHHRDSERILARRFEHTSRPRVREQCPKTRPCPFVSCRHHLYLEIKDTGNIKFVFGETPLESLEQTCSLDVADQYADGLKLDDVGQYVNLTRERVRQIEREALDKLKVYLNIEDDDALIAALKA